MSGPADPPPPLDMARVGQLRERLLVDAKGDGAMHLAIVSAAAALVAAHAAGRPDRAAALNLMLGRFCMTAREIAASLRPQPRPEAKPTHPPQGGVN